MVYNTFDTINKLIHKSSLKAPTKLSITQQFMTSISFNKTRITPLMATPFEEVNVTNTGGIENITKPPDNPNG